MALLHCVVTSPEGMIFEGSARSVVVPAVDGELGILPRHAPLIGALGHGEARIELGEPSQAGSADGSGKARYFLNGGFLQVAQNQVTILATEAQPLESLARAAEEEKVKSLLSARPASGSSLAEREAFEEKLRVARQRVKLAR
jgi:F-type H+-transporting ATPase subunit epsilon